jgi:hypothetical protein
MEPWNGRHMRTSTRRDLGPSARQAAQKQVRIADVPASAGVGVGTVSRVLKGLTPGSVKG